jgi:cell wall-associated NlpC family hydrolase
MHWAFNYLGLPWVSGQDGPDAFDCWGLVRYVQKQHYGRDLSAIHVDADDVRAVVNAFNGNDERNRWHAVDAPTDGDCLLLSQSKEPTHVGVWLDVDGGGLLHAVKGTGVVFSSAANIRLMGYNILGAYTCKPQ